MGEPVNSNLVNKIAQYQDKAKDGNKDDGVTYSIVHVGVCVLIFHGNNNFKWLRKCINPWFSKNIGRKIRSPRGENNGRCQLTNP